MLYCAKAYAKTNLFLDVLCKREDGYHEIDTVMQSVSLYDEVKLKLTDGGVAVFCDRDELSGADNIAAKACEKFLALAGLDVGVEVHIIKNIPVAAGMGGGSADAAAVLLLLNSATGNALSPDELHSIASELGADVPFFLSGGCARAQGIGERLTPVDNVKLYFVFVKEGRKQSTGQMYATLDSTEVLRNGKIDILLSALSCGDVSRLCSNVYNAFEYCWDMDTLLEPFDSFKPSVCFLSGSGPTVAAIFKTKDEAFFCAEALRSRGVNAFFAESVDVGVELV